MIDYENFYKILRPGGVMAFDDLQVGAVKTALDALLKKYDLELHRIRNQGYVYKTKD